MYQFLRTHFSLLMCFLVILMGCTHRKISREFSDTMEDGSRVAIKIEYKPKSVMNSQGEKFGSYYFYYFIVKHFFPTRQIVPIEKTGKNLIDKFGTKPSPILEEYAKPRYRRNARIYISFYDRKGHLLLKGFTPDGYAINFANHEENTFDGGVEWKGQFDERIITVENFRDIHSITAQWR